jgi:hypothetical protein
MSKLILVTTLVVSIVSTSSAFGAAGDSGSERLRHARGKLAAATAGQRPGQAEHRKHELRQLDRWIDDLEDGRPVDPAEIDRSLERIGHEHPNRR